MVCNTFGHGLGRMSMSKQTKRPFRALIILLCAVMTFAPALPSPTGPAAAEAALFEKFSIEQEKELGEKFNTLIRAKLPIVEDPEITGYVKGVVNRVVASMPPIPFEVTTTVVRNNSINAFAAPAGYVFVFTGLINHFDHEAELAGVIAHELAHVSQRHIASRMEKSQIVGMGTMLGTLAGMLLAMGTGSGEAAQAVMMGSAAGGQSMMLKYSRQDEREADQVGMQYLIDANYPPSGMVGAFDKIRRATWVSGGSIVPYLSTHPAVEERINYLSNRIENMPAEITGREHDDNKFKRIQTLIRARYTDPDITLPYFEAGNESECLNALGLGILYDRTNKVAKAEEQFERALHCAPNDSLILREAGRFFFKKGDLDKATRLLQKATFKNPGDLIALFFFARVLEVNKEFGQAEDYYRRILAKLPEDAEVHYHLGRMLGQAGNVFGAHLHLAYSAIYNLDKKQASFHMGKARSLGQSPEQQKEIEALEKVHSERAEYW